MDIMEWTPLMHAARNGEVETVQKLLKSKEKIHLKNMLGADLLTLSAASGNKSVFKIILGEMKNISSDNTVDLSYVLRIAALFGHTDIVKFILNSECDPNAKDPVSGATALMLATSCGHYSVVRLLLSYGALVDNTNVFCQSAIDIAESKHYNDLAELLKTKATFDSRKFRPNLLMPLELPKINYKVRELASCSTNLQQKRTASPITDRFSCATEELDSPMTAFISEVANTCRLSPVTLLPTYVCETFSPDNFVSLSENQSHKRTTYDTTKPIACCCSKTVGVGHTSNGGDNFLSPHYPKKFDILRKHEFSRAFDKSTQEEKFHDNLELSTDKMFQYNSCSQPNSPCSPSPTSGNMFSQSDPSVIHELNGGTGHQKGRKKAFWHSIRRRVRSLAHDKNGYHFFHPYCDSAVPEKCRVSSPRIQIDDDIKFKIIEVSSEGERDDSAHKIAVSPLSSSLEFDESYKNATKSVQRERPVHSDFKEFLCANGLHRFVNTFFEHELDLMTFFELRDVDLREIGISSREDRRKILNVIASQRHSCV